jgi:hypothetical protein
LTAEEKNYTSDCCQNVLFIFFRHFVIHHDCEDDRQHNGQKKKGQNDKQRSTKHTHKTKDRVTRTPLTTRDEQ